MQNKIKVEVTAEIPEELLFEFLQHIRNFDTAHSKDVFIGIGIDAPNMSLEEVAKMYGRLKPPLPPPQFFRKTS